MLLRFAVSNFLSISEEIDFTLFPYTRLRDKKSHIYQTPGVDLLKVAAVYGANGSGKSNLVKAMGCLRDFVLFGDLLKSQQIIGPFRLSEELIGQPSVMEIEFFHSGTYYSYELSASRNQVYTEVLSITYPPGERREVLFSRTVKEGKPSLTFAPRYQQSEEDRARINIYVNELLTPTASLLTVLARNDAFPELQQVAEWFRNRFLVIQPNDVFSNFAEVLYLDTEFAAFALNLLKTLDTGITDITLERMTYDTFFGLDAEAQKREALAALNQGVDYLKVTVYGEVMLLKLEEGELMVYRALFIHETADGVPIKFSVREESDGTRRVLDFLPVWRTLKSEAAAVVIDEVGRSLHPKLLEQLIQIFMTQPMTGQLIFTTHEDALLSQELFRRDEIHLLNKTKAGNSEVYPLSDFKKARHDTDLRKNFLFGRFGGTPRITPYFSLEQRAAAYE